MAFTASFHWDVPPEALARAVGTYGKRLIAAISKLATFFAAKMEASAKANAKWTDRTGHARQGLTGRAIATATGVVIILYHQVWYGIWLEVAHAGAWGIIMDTMFAHYGPLMAALKRLIGA